jgi:hypothetical protein
MSLQAVDYNLNAEADGTTKHAGFIAQDFKDIFPDLTVQDADGYYSISYSGLTPYLVKAVQQQQQQIAGLQQGASGVQGVGSNASFASLNVSGATTLASLTVTGSVAVGGDLTVTGNATVANLYVGGKIVLRGARPTSSVGAGLIPGTIPGSSVLVDGNDTAGTITVNTADTQVLGANSSTPFSGGEMASVNFTAAFGQQPRVILTPINEDSATVQAYVVSTPTGFKLKFVQAPGTNKTYSFNYLIVGAEVTP